MKCTFACHVRRVAQFPTLDLETVWDVPYVGVDPVPGWRGVLSPSLGWQGPDVLVMCSGACQPVSLSPKWGCMVTGGGLQVLPSDPQCCHSPVSRACFLCSIQHPDRCGWGHAQDAERSSGLGGDMAGSARGLALHALLTNPACSPEGRSVEAGSWDGLLGVPLLRGRNS